MRVHQQPEIGVVALVVLDHGVAEPGEIVLVCCLVGLLLPQRRVGGGLFGKAADHEIELDRHRLFGPERAVVVEHGHPLRHGDEVGAAFVRDGFHE